VPGKANDTNNGTTDGIANSTANGIANGISSGLANDIAIVIDITDEKGNIIAFVIANCVSDSKVI
jgi:hypothetical protein